MALVMESAETYAADSETGGAFEVNVRVAESERFGFLLDPSEGAVGPDHFRTGRKRLPRYFRSLHVPSERALALVDDLLPQHPEIVSLQSQSLLVSTLWGAEGPSVGVFVNTAFRRHNELLVRVPSWSRTVLESQPIERWVALQPHLSRIGKVVRIGIETSKAGRSALEIGVEAENLRAEDLKELAMLAGAPSGELIHLWRTLSVAGFGKSSPTLVSFRLSGREALDLGVTFPAWRAGSSAEIQQRFKWLARVYHLETGRYLESLEELESLTGRAPEHRNVGFGSEKGGLHLTASFESFAAAPSESLAS